MLETIKHTTIAAFNPPRGWAQIAVQMVSGLTRAEGSPRFMRRSLCAICPEDPHR